MEHTPSSIPATTASPGQATSARQGSRLPVRLVSAMVFFATLGLLVVAAWLNPSGGGMGTHRQLGLPPCGMLEATGIPCATCGMTTAFAYAADGRLVRSFLTQPAGMLLAVMTAAATVASGFSMVTGMSMAPMFKGFLKPMPMIALGVIVALAWMYKIAVVTGLLPSL